MGEIDLDSYQIKPLVIEAQLKGFDLEADEEFLQTLVKCGYDYRRVAKSYSFTCLKCVTHAIIAKCLPSMPEEAAAIELGRRNYEGTRKTILGRVVMSAFHVMSVERAFSVLMQNLNKDTGYGHRELKLLGVNHLVLDFNDDPAASSVIGINSAVGWCTRMLEDFKISNPQVKASVTGPLSYSLELQWEDGPKI
jgi:uncharacterized protein (TIGR02265 family)